MKFTLLIKSLKTSGVLGDNSALPSPLYTFWHRRLFDRMLQIYYSDSRLLFSFWLKATL